MVIGVDRFRKHFSGHEHQYVLIGGAACDLIMDEVGIDFRATKDLDIVLIVEALDKTFSACFWAFIEAGEYEVRERSDGDKILYRFQKPKAPDFPAMLELFSRSPEGLKLPADSHLTPLPIDEAAASLSAILLDENYYDFLKTMVRDVDGLPVLNEAAIIPFKARAWIDLTKQQQSGGMVDARDIKKHRNDVARLLQLLSPESRVQLPAGVEEDMLTFLKMLSGDADFYPKQFNVNYTREEVVERLRAAYQL